MATKAKTTAPKATTKAVAIKGGALDIFNTQEAALVPLVAGGMSSDYVQFFHPNANNAGAVYALYKGIKEGVPLLIQGNDITKLDPFQFLAPPCYFQYYAETDGDGIPTSACGTEGRRPSGWDEFVEAVILVVINTGKTYAIHPAQMRFRGPKCPCYLGADKARIEASLPEWVARSPAHKAASQSGLASWAWNIHTVDLTTKSPRKKLDEKGNPTKDYVQASSSSEAAPIMVLRTLIELQKNDTEFAELLQKCMDGFNSRKDEIEKLF